MNKVTVFIDGFNIYHALEDNPSYHKYKWLNLEKLSKCFVGSKDTITKNFYFTAYATWNMQKLSRHKIYVEALRLAGVEIIFGAFRRKNRLCRVCNKRYLTFEEKRTDVNIAIRLFQTAIAGLWDTALIISGDSDLIPAIQAIKSTFPNKKIGVVIPIGRRAEELKLATDFHAKIKEKHLKSCQVDDKIRLDGGHVLKRPQSWQ